MGESNQAKEIFFPVFGAALHSGLQQLMMSRTLAGAIHTHYKIRRGAKNPSNSNCDDFKTIQDFKKLNTVQIVQGVVSILKFEWCL